MEIAMSSIVRARLSLPAVAAILSLFAGSGAANAQGRDAPAAYPGMNQRGAMTCRMDEYVDGDLAFLKTELKITEAQMPQWNAFAQAFRSERQKTASLCKQAMEQAKEMRSASLPDTLKMAEDQLSGRLDSLREMKAAVDPLYSSLSNEQKKTADQIMRGGQMF
jgi:LTXXQ motif family protein